MEDDLKKIIQPNTIKIKTKNGCGTDPVNLVFTHYHSLQYFITLKKKKNYHKIIADRSKQLFCMTERTQMWKKIKVFCGSKIEK